jgi:hypothetical protein
VNETCTIRLQCGACHQWAPVWLGNTCPMCGQADPAFGEMAEKPCGQCGAPVMWPVVDDYDVLCSVCIHALVNAVLA